MYAAENAKAAEKKNVFLNNPSYIPKRIILPFQTDKRRLKQALRPFLAVKMKEGTKKEEARNITGNNNNVFRAVRFTCATAREKRAF